MGAAHLFSEIGGKDFTYFYDCIIAVTKRNGAYLIYSTPDVSIFFDGSMLQDNLTDESAIPEVPGIYKCKIKYFFFKNSHPEGPLEHDAIITIESPEKIDFGFEDQIDIEEPKTDDRDILAKLYGKSLTSFHDCIIAVGKPINNTFLRYYSTYLIHSTPNLSEMLEDDILTDYVKDVTKIPKEIGVYRCNIKYTCFKCSHPLDHDEYDSFITIESYQKLNIGFSGQMENAGTD